MKLLKNILFFSLLFLPVIAKAASLSDTLGLTSFGDQTNLIKPGADINSTKAVVANIINILLSFLGMIFTILIIYGGFKWMLSRGNSNQVDEAKSVIKNATIGLAIVLLSYVISRTILLIIEGEEATPPGFIGPPSP